ncbi:PDZ domain-containing protein [Helicobacter sp. L8]|uniref:PDZ domain-containing protein n=1 Tax=Helicobacter sp. L8 TaxID=2316078 RepID=UPI000EB54694|nr:PDZ domain-containing protein [Helicobacter sp. L8]
MAQELMRAGLAILVFSLLQANPIPNKEALEPCKEQKEKYSGVGATITSYQHRPMVIALLQGGPAQKAGLKSGDVILKVNGQDTWDVDIHDVTARIRGKPLSVVVLTIKRDVSHGLYKTLDIKIVRQMVTLGFLGKENNTPKHKSCYRAQVWHGS